jgi:hypothetical protein
MLGYAADKNSDQWKTFLQAIEESATAQGITTLIDRIGGGETKDLSMASTSQATDPCFFKGCGGYSPVASSLGSVWTKENRTDKNNLRILISDLEVNDNNIRSLVSATKEAINGGSIIGVIGVRLPFTGNVYSPGSEVIFSGQTIRPVYLLATGEAGQLSSFIDDTVRTLKQRGINQIESTLMEPKLYKKSLEARQVRIPGMKGAQDNAVTWRGKKYVAANNDQYRFLTLFSEAEGFSVSSDADGRAGTKTDDLGIVRINRYDAQDKPEESAEGVRIESMSFSGPNVTLDVGIDKNAESGPLRLLIPAGHLPMQWWLEWNRQQHSSKRKDPTKTEGLFPLLSRLNTELAKRYPTKPAAIFCIALQQT